MDDATHKAMAMQVTAGALTLWLFKCWHAHTFIEPDDTVALMLGQLWLPICLAIRAKILARLGAPMPANPPPYWEKVNGRSDE